MYAQMVTGSLPFGSPHRLVRSCLYSVVLSLRWTDDLDISRESTGISQNHHLGTVVSRIMPDICISVWTVIVEIYLVPLNAKLNYATIVLLLCYFYRAFVASAMASGRSSDMDQVGPSSAPSDPLLGKFFGPSLDITSEKVYDLAPDIPDVMGLRALRPSAAVVKVMSVPDSRCIRVVTPDDHVNIGFHEILLHDMGEEELPFVATSELNYLRHVCFYVKIPAGSGTHAERVHGTVWLYTVRELHTYTVHSHSCGAARLCGARCGRGLLRTVLIICGEFGQVLSAMDSYQRTVGGHDDAIHLRGGD